MVAVKQYISVAMVATALGLLTVACGESKVAQCNKFSDIAKKAQDFSNGAKDLKQLKDPNQIADKINSLADKLDGNKKELQALSFSDEKLKSFQTQYADLIGTGVTSMRDLASALKTKNLPQLSQSARTLQELGPKLLNVDTDLKKYCTAS